ncbi:hypothetical protein IV203_017090 [Nitzschia inconspicua]|uniref:Uncharacterized protein n=1 Tax=Nitzschia inconspicua TaxID=303405 RepID=A0A9K3PIE0_9STRA|nr:hypothetical protein IV203_017090 [Nitzschia inconspicua]
MKKSTSSSLTDPADPAGSPCQLAIRHSNTQMNFAPATIAIAAIAIAITATAIAITAIAFAIVNAIRYCHYHRHCDLPATIA